MVMEKKIAEKKEKIVNGVKVLSSAIPEDRPTQDKWLKKLKISEMAWYHHPDGRQRAEEIMESVGIEYTTAWDNIKNSFKVSE